MLVGRLRGLHLAVVGLILGLLLVIGAAGPVAAAPLSGPGHASGGLEFTYDDADAHTAQVGLYETDGTDAAGFDRAPSTGPMRLSWHTYDSSSNFVAPRGAGLVDDVGDVAFRSDTTHIFRDAPGHLLDDTAANRALITDAVRPANLVREVTAGSSTIRRYQQLLPDGTQVWVEVRNGVEITNGGLNLVPR